MENNSRDIIVYARRKGKRDEQAPAPGGPGPAPAPGGPGPPPAPGGPGPAPAPAGPGPAPAPAGPGPAPAPGGPGPAPAPGGPGPAPAPGGPGPAPAPGGPGPAPGPGGPGIALGPVDTTRYSRRKGKRADYGRRISSKLPTIETKHPMPNAMPSNSVNIGQNPLDSGSQSMQSQSNSQGPPLPVPVPTILSQSGQDISQNFANNIAAAGMQGSAGLISAPTIKECEKLYFSSPDGNVIFELEEELATILREYQVEGVRWLFDLHVRKEGGILADDMGLGKTKQVCAFLKGLFSTSSIKRVMILAPATLLINWKGELNTMKLSASNDISVNIYPGKASATKEIVEGSQILLVSYQRLNGDELYTGLFNRLKWDHVILDEGHLLKNPRGIRAQNVKKIRAKAGAFIILTGTAIQNNLQELWALMNICNKNVLGTEERFRSDFDVTIQLGNRRTLDQMTYVYAREAAKKLQKLVEPYYLRREKGILELPGKDELVIWLKLTPLQQKLYMQFLKFLASNAQKGIHKDRLPSIRLLENLCLHPKILTNQAKSEEFKTGCDRDLLKRFRALVFDEINVASGIECSVKLKFLGEMLPKIIRDGDSVLIFSNSCEMLTLVEYMIKDKYGFVRIDGSASYDVREKATEEFQAGNVPILLLSIKVGALGLTLTKATKVILLEPNWNPSYDNQAVDRAHRYGQTKKVMVYRLICSGTIEERVYRTQVYKNTLSRSLHSKKEQPLKVFNPKDDIKAFAASISGFNRSETKAEIDRLLQLHSMETSLKRHIRFLEAKDYIAGVTYHTEVISRVQRDDNKPVETFTCRP